MMIRSWVELDEAMLDIDHGTPGQHLVYMLVRQLPLLTVSPEVRECNVPTHKGLGTWIGITRIILMGNRVLDVPTRPP